MANGFSGHGFELAPAVGSMVARALTGEGASFDTEVPLDLLSVERAPLRVRSRSVLA